MASAYFLQRSGWNVSVVDRGELGEGCSFGNACLIVPCHSEPIPGPGVVGQALRWMLSRESPFYVRPRLDLDFFRFLWAFRRYCNEAALERAMESLLPLSRGSLELYGELVRTGEADFFFEKRGVLEVYLERASLEAGRASVEHLAELGFPARFLTGDEARSLEPALSPAIQGAVYVPSEAHGYCYGYVRALARTVAERGGSFLPGRKVARILRSRSRVRGVELEGPREELAADLVVLAAGSWSPALAASLDLHIPLQPAKGYSCTIDAYDDGPSIPIMIKERRVIVTPLAERLRFGGTLELAGLDRSIDPARYRAVVRAGREVLRVPPPMANESPWCGLRPVTPDGVPVIDRVEDGLIVATGHAMMGFTQSPLTGKLVSELANGAPSSMPVEGFRLSRF